MKRLNSILFGLGLGFLAYLVWHVGPTELRQEMGALGWGLALLILAEGLANLAHTVGWRHCIAETQKRIPLLHLFRMAMAGYAINYLTPSASLGGEVSRAALLASSHKGVEAVRSVLLDKLMTGIAHLLLVLLGTVLLFWRVSLPVQLWLAMAVITAVMTAAMVVFFVLQKQGKLGSFCRWLVRHRLAGRLAREAEQRLSKVDHTLRQFYREKPGHLVLSVVWHLIGHSAALVQAWLFLRLAGQPASLITAAAAGFLSLWFDLLTFAIPMNAGTLEGSRILAFKALGCQALMGMTFGVATRIVQLFWACTGMLCYALLVRHKKGVASKDLKGMVGRPKDVRASEGKPSTAISLAADASGEAGCVE